MMKTFQYKFISILAIVLLFAGCEKGWLDINDDPNNPIDAKINLLLPGAQYDIADFLSMGYFNVGYKAGVYVHQIATRESIDKYGISAGDIGYFSQFYDGPIADLDLLIETATASDNQIYAGIGKIMKAYTYSQIVDLWGDVPFTEANQPGITYPAYDDDEAIYAALFTLIDEGIANIEATAANILVPGNDDLIYGGDTDLWIKAANTLKLKLYNQVRLTSLFSATAVNALLAGELIEEGEDFMMWFGTSSNPENRNPGMKDEYAGSQISTYISPWFFEILKGENPGILTGIEDPRIPYYFCNQSGGDTENPPEYMYGDFVSIYFGSDGINRDHAGRSTFTMVGFYPCGGRYDDGTFDDQLTGSDAAGDAPMRYITYADRKFIEAELYAKGGITGDARAAFEEGLEASFELIDEIVGGTADGMSIPTIAGTTAADDYIALVLAAYDAGTAEEQFELIMTEKWIQSWGANVDSYTDYRRTGYPVLFDPNTDPSDGGPDGSGPVPTSLSRGYVVAFPYPTSEMDLNYNAPAQRNPTSDKVFWDID